MLSEKQAEVNLYFHHESTFWKEIYTSENVYARIHQQRHECVLTWVEELGLAANARILEVGCGAGFLSLALAERGYTVHATDSVGAMVEQTRRHAQEAGQTARISTEVCDISALPFEDKSFDLVLAIGVFPWIESVDAALQEIERVLKPGGHLLATADNRARLNIWLDPLLLPWLSPLKQSVKILLDRSGLRRRSVKDVGAHAHSTRMIDNLLTSFALIKVKSVTLGFGPFTLLRRRLLSNAAGIRLHERLQRFAELGVPIFRSTGMQYIILAEKPFPDHFPQPTGTPKFLSDTSVAQ